jgi:hypothetical protein
MTDSPRLDVPVDELPTEQVCKVVVVRRAVENGRESEHADLGLSI